MLKLPDAGAPGFGKFFVGRIFYVSLAAGADCGRRRQKEGEYAQTAHFLSGQALL